MVKILIIDDNISVSRAIARLYNHRGHETITAANGQDGLKALAENPDLVLCDYAMLQMDGYEFTHQVRTNPDYQTHSDIPIIGIGDFPPDKTEHLTLSLKKPIKHEKIHQYIEENFP